jgi:teichuronic acid biosynthesis glycosyltransferase TuaG
VKNCVDIVMPAYNAARFIGQAIDSVRAQTCSNWRLLVVDDCSRDDTVQVVESYARCDDRVILLRNPTNGGPAAARATALSVIESRFVAFLDSDDCWLPQKLERQLSAMDASGAAMTYSAYRRMSEDSSIVGSLVKVPSRMTHRGFLKNTAIFTSTVVVDRAKVGPITMRNTYHDDIMLWLDLLRQGILCVGVNEDLLRYRVVHASYSRNKLKNAYELWKAYRFEEGLTSVTAAWYIGHYAVNALIKYARF